MWGVSAGDGVGQFCADELRTHGVGEGQRGQLVGLRIEVLAPMVAFGRWLAVVPTAGADPPVQAVSQIFGRGAEPCLVDQAFAQHVLPEQHAQAVMAQGVGLGRVGLSAAKCFEDIRALALEGLCELAQVVQGEPETDPRFYQRFWQPQVIGEETSQCRQAAQRLRPHSGDVEAVVGEQMASGAGFTRARLAPMAGIGRRSI